MDGRQRRQWLLSSSAAYEPSPLQLFAAGHVGQLERIIDAAALGFGRQLLTRREGRRPVSGVG